MNSAQSELGWNMPIFRTCLRVDFKLEGDAYGDSQRARHWSKGGERSQGESRWWLGLLVWFTGEVGVILTNFEVASLHILG